MNRTWVKEITSPHHPTQSPLLWAIVLWNRPRTITIHLAVSVAFNSFRGGGGRDSSFRWWERDQEWGVLEPGHSLVVVYALAQSQVHGKAEEEDERKKECCARCDDSRALIRTPEKLHFLTTTTTLIDTQPVESRGSTCGHFRIAPSSATNGTVYYGNN